VQVLVNRAAVVHLRPERLSATTRRSGESRLPVDRADLMDTGARARLMLSLQRHAGNVAVQALLADSARSPVVQRCGPTPCDCPADQKAATEQAGVVEAGPSVQEEPAVQRLVAAPATRIEFDGRSL
jgi:hypothetical protein